MARKNRKKYKMPRKIENQENANLKYTPMPADLFDKVRNAVKSEIQIRRSALNHLWKRHGCYENAKTEQFLTTNRGKMPSYFKNDKILAKAIASTLNRPNWTRSSETKQNGKFRFQKPGVNTGGMGRFRGKNYAKNLKKHDKNQKKKFGIGTIRKLHFKTFTKSIGTSGIGYGVVRGTDNASCDCCCAVVDPDHGLITAFPILTRDASVKGEGKKTHLNEDASSISESSGSEKSEISTADLESAKSIKSDESDISEKSTSTEWETDFTFSTGTEAQSDNEEENDEGTS